jgi:hypothetical protein
LASFFLAPVFYAARTGSPKKIKRIRTEIEIYIKKNKPAFSGGEREKKEKKSPPTTNYLTTIAVL